MGILNRLKQLKKSYSSYQPLIEVRVFRGNLLHNLNTFRAAYPGIKFAPVIKSNAYGHGLIEVASVLDNQGSPFFMVDSLFEALTLRNNGIKTPLLILGYTAVNNINSQKLKQTAFGIISLGQLLEINKGLQRKTRFHLKIDTGMHRQGLTEEELPEAIKIVKSNPLIEIEGLCSHLADADGENDNFSNQQIILWNRIINGLARELGEIKYKHLTNSAGADLAAKAIVNIGRLGIGLYGFNFSPRKPLNLKPALETRSVISSIRKLKAGEKVGYNITFSANRDIIAATVPAGYAEGIDRRLSGTGSMEISGVPCPILGRVSMNITSIDVSNIAGANVGQSVVIFSKNPEDSNSIENVAKLCGTIPYEILVHIPSYLRRLLI